MKDLAYKVFRNLAFKLPAELAHTAGLKLLGLTCRVDRPHFFADPPPSKPVRVMGLDFANPIGLAAGLDKNGDYIDALGSLGFGFLELGTVTPRPQPGNPKPRLFRIPEHQAIVNRMGFNNKGIDHLVDRIRHARYNGIIGVNIGKNFDTPIEKAADDYLIGLEKAWAVADYIAVNISSPNTKNLRDLQVGDHFSALLEQLSTRKNELALATGKKVPVVIKIAPDLDTPEVARIAYALLAFGFDGVIATNTTIGREGVESSPIAKEQGGLSGKPVFEKSNTVLRLLAAELRGRLPIIGVGGILSGADAKAKLDLGASLVQIYSGFIYRGPALVGECGRALLA
jgi:dihydroorotate dehydrogenase